MKVYTVRYEGFHYDVNEAFSTMELAEEMVKRVGVGYIQEYEVKDKVDDEFLFVVIFDKIEQETRLMGSYDYPYPTLMVNSPFEANVVLWARNKDEATKNGTEILINFLNSGQKICRNFIYNADTFEKVNECHTYLGFGELSDIEKKILTTNITKDKNGRYENAMFVSLFSSMDKNRNVKIVCDAEEVGQIFSEVTGTTIHINEKDKNDFLSKAKNMGFSEIKKTEYEFVLNGENAVKNLGKNEKYSN